LYFGIIIIIIFIVDDVGMMVVLGIYGCEFDSSCSGVGGLRFFWVLVLGELTRFRLVLVELTVVLSSSSRSSFFLTWKGFVKGFGIRFIVVVVGLLWVNVLVMVLSDFLVMISVAVDVGDCVCVGGRDGVILSDCSSSWCSCVVVSL
jgi:hypothetical protein